MLNGERVAVTVHEDLNSAKRGLIPMTDELSAFSDGLESALLSLPEIGDNTFYRVANLPQELIEKILQEGSFDDAGFLSASFDKARALTHPGNVYRAMR